MKPPDQATQDRNTMLAHALAHDPDQWEAVFGALKRHQDRDSGYARILSVAEALFTQRAGSLKGPDLMREVARDMIHTQYVEIVDLGLAFEWALMAREQELEAKEKAITQE
jgi:hypothetical protein